MQCLTILAFQALQCFTTVENCDYSDSFWRGFKDWMGSLNVIELKRL